MYICKKKELMYKYSKDYNELWTLIRDGVVVHCIVDFNRKYGWPIVRDFASVKLIDCIGAVVGTRGHEYFRAKTKKTFVKLCTSNNLEWLCADTV